jgi:DNA-binding NarL/FixJ family response regulator
VRVVVAEDAVLLREGLVGLLERFGHEVIASVGDAGALEAAVRHDPPDVVVTDVRMPPGYTDEGLRAAVTLRSAYPSLAVLVLSQYVQPTYVAELLDTGGGRGVGYLLKHRVGRVEEFMDALTRVAAGGAAVDPEVVAQLLGRRRDPLTRLTPREREVLALLGRGLSNTELARALTLSEATVKTHVARIFAKLALRDRAQAVVLAYETGLVTPGED